MKNEERNKLIEAVTEEIYAEIPQSLVLTDDEWDIVQASRRRGTLTNKALANYIISALAIGKSLRKLSGELTEKFDCPVSFVTLHHLASDPEIKPIINRMKASVEDCLDLVPIYSKANRILKIQEIFDECDTIKEAGTRIKMKLAAIKLANDIIEGSNIHITQTQEKKFELVVSQIDSANRALPERNGMNIAEWLQTTPKKTSEVITKVQKRL